jgi:hypothetical protein
MTQEQKAKLQQAIELLNQADVLVQEALGADDECYYIHTQIENASDDITDILGGQDE